MSRRSPKSKASSIAFAATLSCGLLVIGFPISVVAHEHEEMCGPIVDGDGEAVLQRDGDILLHGGSFPCPPKEKVVEPVATASITSVVLFDFDVDVPNDEGETALQELITEFRDRAPDRVIIGGHADRAGTEAYNQDLSQRRADNVAKSLIAGGIDARSVTVEAFGESRPAVATEDGIRESANRRVEVDANF